MPAVASWPEKSGIFSRSTLPDGMSNAPFGYYDTFRALLCRIDLE